MVIDYSRSKAENVTNTHLKGTIKYIAPEHLKDHLLKKTETFDVFSYGITAWEILSEKDAYYDIDCKNLLPHYVTEKGTRPETKDIDEGVPEPIVQIIEDCWHQAKERRPAFRDVENFLFEQLAMLVQELAESRKSLTEQVQDVTQLLQTSVNIAAINEEITHGHVEINAALGQKREWPFIIVINTHAADSQFCELLDPNNIGIETTITFLACF